MRNKTQQFQEVSDLIQCAINKCFIIKSLQYRIQRLIEGGAYSRALLNTKVFV